MNKANEELFRKYLANKIKFYTDFITISDYADDLYGALRSEYVEILSQFEALVKRETLVEASAADLDMRDHNG